MPFPSALLRRRGHIYSRVKNEMKTNKKTGKYASKIKFRFTGDTVPDLPYGVRVELFGRKSALIEGCRGVAEYDSDSITLTGKPRVRVRGSGLELRSLGNGSAQVKGRIDGVDLISEDEKC